MKNYQLYFIALILATLVACENDPDKKNNQLLFTTGFSWELTQYYEGWYSYTGLEKDMFWAKIFDTTIYYYAGDSIINYHFTGETTDTAFSLIYHKYLYNSKTTYQNSTTGDEQIIRDTALLGIYRVINEEKTICWQNTLPCTILYNFNVEIGDTLECYESFAHGFPEYYADIITNITFVRIGPHRLKRYYWEEKWENGYISDVKGEYIEGIGTLQGLISGTSSSKLEYFIINNVKYKLEDIIFEN